MLQAARQRRTVNFGEMSQPARPAAKSPSLIAPGQKGRSCTDGQKNSERKLK
ncbi:MAG: hypothetical protein V7638_2487 [Acidobacteriota bacterium]|jgi:hypothetical protein